MRKKTFSVVFVLVVLIFSFAFAKTVLAYQPGPMITFTFDDGARSIYEQAVPILARYKIPAVFYGETGPLNSGEDWVMTWSQVKSLRDKYGWEIGSHSIWHLYLTQVSDEVLTQELLGAKQDFASQGINVKTFATPYGDYNAKVLAAIAKYYESHRAAWGGPNVWPNTFNDYEIVSQEVSRNTSPTTVRQWVDQAIAKKQWLVLLFHEIVKRNPAEYQYNVTKFQQIVNYIVSKPIKPVTISQGLRFSDQPNPINNFTFLELDANGWAKNWLRNNEVSVGIDTASRGNAPSSENSLKIIGSPAKNEAKTEMIKIDSTKEYLLKMYQNVQDLLAGSWTVSVDEFGLDNSLLNSQWLGSHFSNFVGDRYYQYKPSSLAVDKIQINIFTDENSQLTLYADSVELRSVGALTSLAPNLVENFSFENLIAGWADKWTRDDPAIIVIDANNNGYGASIKNSLKIIGGQNQRTAFSSLISVVPSQNYQLSFYQKIDNFAAGGAGVWIDEFNRSNRWISGSWLGGTYQATKGVKTFSYRSTSSNVSKIQIHLFTEENSQLTLYIDAVEFRANN